MTSWWRKFAEQLEETTEDGSWPRQVAEFTDATAGSGSWKRRLARIVDDPGTTGCWTRRIVKAGSTGTGSWARRLVEHGGRVPLNIDVREEEVDIPSETDGDASGLDQGTLIFDGGFSDAPTVSNQGNGKRFKGASRDYAKFLFSIGAPVAGQVYTMTYDPDWSALSQGGALAMIGLGFKAGNEYHIPGLRGDGADGLNAYKVQGANFNNLKAGSGTDGGAAAHGTQAGPNWLQAEIAGDASTYTMRTSADGETWADEFTAAVPSPIDSTGGAEKFGVAVYLDAADQGEFTIDVTLWELTFIVGGLLLEGDAQSDGDLLLLAGDEQSGGDVELYREAA